MFMNNDVIRALQDLVEGIVYNPLSHELDMDLIEDDLDMVLGIFVVVSTKYHVWDDLTTEYFERHSIIFYLFL